MFPGLTGVPSAHSPGVNQGSRVTPTVPGAREPPWQVRATPLPQVAGGRAASAASCACGSFPRLHLLRGGRRRLVPPTTKGRPAESAPARAAPPWLPASAPASPREPLPRHRLLQVPGRGRGRGDNNPAGGRRGGKARRRAPRQREGGASGRAAAPLVGIAPPAAAHW